MCTYISQNQTNEDVVSYLYYELLECMASNDKKENEFLPLSVIYLVYVQLSKFILEIDSFLTVKS